MTRINEFTRIDLSADRQDKKIIHKELSFNIMEATFEVHNTLGPGYSEGIYESALAKEFRDRNIKYERQI